MDDQPHSVESSSSPDTSPDQPAMAGEPISSGELDALAAEVVQPAETSDPSPVPEGSEVAAPDNGGDPVSAAFHGPDACATPPAVIGAKVAVSADAAEPVEVPELSDEESRTLNDIEVLDDVELEVKIELGRTQMYIEDVLRLGEGSVVELEKLAGDPVDVYVNERLVARGEVLVLNDSFCVRINEIVSPAAKDEDDSV